MTGCNQVFSVISYALQHTLFNINLSRTAILQTRASGENHSFLLGFQTFACPRVPILGSG